MTMKLPGGKIYVTPPGDPKTSVVPIVGWVKSTEVLANPCPTIPAGALSPEFITAIESKAPIIARRLMVGVTDMSSRVLRWPTIKLDITKVRTSNMTINLANADKTLNYLVTDWASLGDTVTVQFGVSHGPTCPVEYFTVFAGEISSTTQANSVVSLSLVDNLKAFNDTLVGTESVPVTYAMQNISDLLWDLVTTHGGLDATADATNPDIDYASWAAWKAHTTLFLYRGAGSLPGVSIFDVMQEIADVYRVSMIFEGGRLSFGAWTFLPAEGITQVTESRIVRVKTSLDAKKIVNSVTVNYDYDVVTETHGGSTTEENAASVTLFGRKSLTKSTTNVWPNLVTAGAVDDLHVDEFASPFVEYTIDGTLGLMVKKINARLTFVDPQLDITIATVFRVMTTEFNMDTGETSLTLRNS